MPHKIYECDKQDLKNNSYSSHSSIYSVTLCHEFARSSCNFILIKIKTKIKIKIKIKTKMF